MGAGRRILLISPWLPEPPYWGSGIRVRELLKGLSRTNSVTLVSYVHPWEQEHVAAVRQLCDSVHTVAASPAQGPDRIGRLMSLVSRESHYFRRFIRPALQATIDQLLTSEGYDLVQVESGCLADLDLSRAPTTILDEHNIEYELLARAIWLERSLPRRLFAMVEYPKVRRAERRAWRRFDGCVVTSEREVPEIRRFAPGRPVAAVPNGVDTDYFAPQRRTTASGLVFTGLMRYRPNVDGITYFVKEVLPLVHEIRPDVTLTIVGWGNNDEVDALLGPKVRATGRVADVRPYLAGAAAVVAPVRIGGGTRLKVLEALAMGKPLIATSTACEGLDLVDGRDLVMADGPRAFADAVLRILADQKYGARLGDAGRRVVAARYSWVSSIARLEELHDSGLRARRCEPIASTVQGPSKTPLTSTAHVE